MPAEVRIHYENTPEYLAAAFAEHGKIEPRRGITVLVYLVIAFVCGLPFSLWCVWHAGDLDRKWFVTANLVSPLAILFLAIRSFSVRRAINEAQPLSAIDRQVSITVNTQGWLSESAFSRGEEQWAAFRKVTRVEAGFLATYSFVGNRWLPCTGFESDAAMDSFVRLVQGASIEYEDRRAG